MPAIGKKIFIRDTEGTRSIAAGKDWINWNDLHPTFLSTFLIVSHPDSIAMLSIGEVSKRSAITKFRMPK